MTKFPVDAPKTSCQSVGVARFSNSSRARHIAMIRENADGTKTPLTMPNHSQIKGSTLRTICNQSGISREDFLREFENS